MTLYEHLTERTEEELELADKLWQSGSASEALMTWMVSDAIRKARDELPPIEASRAYIGY